MSREPDARDVSGGGPEQFFAGAPLISQLKLNVIFSTPMLRSMEVLKSDQSPLVGSFEQL